MIPKSLEAAIKEIIRNLGDLTEIINQTPVGGGCINNATRIIAGKRSYMLKWNMHSPPDMFSAEARGLKLLEETKTIRVPMVYASSEGKPGVPNFILMEWLAKPSGERGLFDQSALGIQIGLLHKKGISPKNPPMYGLDHDNYIGRISQKNGWEADWVRFYRDYRLLPQMEFAHKKGRLPKIRRKKLELLRERLDKWFAGINRCPSLLHGDLWGGNAMTGPGTIPVIVDPAVYYGDREADIAFTELFGGFSSRFYDGYREIWPLEPDYHERKDLYNLYHLINHLNHFGEPYGFQVDTILEKYIGN
ncbi:MAG: fructosamine kinase family protein [Anaerolineaceae bacterium]|nr:fructosamine kinase family protein [Anaerolineaceae bacterium]